MCVTCILLNLYLVCTEVRYRSVRYEEIFSSDSNKFGNVIDNKFGDVIGDIIPVSMSPDIDRRGKVS